MSKDAARGYTGTHDSSGLPNTSESREESICSYTQNKVEESVVEDWSGQDGDREFYKNLNSIILQYLDISGLDQSYRTFYDECQTVGYMLPESWSAEPESSLYSIDYEDIDRLLRHFDEENGKSLLELWDSVMEGGIGEHAEVFRISVYLHIYVALIPFRRNLGNDEKVLGMQNLRDYFQSKTDDCTKDEEVLKYFALPFVQDPQAHPIFSKLLTEAWIDDVRTRLQKLTTTISSKKTTISCLETDLAQLFLSWSESVQHKVELEHGQSWTLQTTPHPVTLTSSASFNIKSLKDDNPLRKFFENIDELTEENRRLKIKETESEYKYSQLLNFCAVLVGYLVEACKGKSVDMVQLKNNICEVFPQIVQSNELNTSHVEKLTDNNVKVRARNCSNVNSGRPDRIKSTKEKDTHHPKGNNRLNSRRTTSKQLSQRQNVFTTQKAATEDVKKSCDEKKIYGHHRQGNVQNSFRELEAKTVTPKAMQPKIRLVASCCEHGNPCDHNHLKDLTRSHTTMDQFQNCSDYKTKSSTRYRNSSTRTRSRSHSPEHQPNPSRCDSIPARNQKTKSSSPICLTNIEIGNGENELLDTASRPRTYELESMTSLESRSDCQETAMYSRHSQTQSCASAIQPKDNDDLRYGSSQRQSKEEVCQQGDNYRSPGRQTYRVRVINASHVSSVPVKTISINNSTERSREIDQSPNSVKSTTSQKFQMNKQQPSETDHSARGVVTRTRDTETYPEARRSPYISTTDNNKCTISNSNASWKSVSHTADNVAIKIQAVNKEQHNEFSPRLLLMQPRRSVSETNLGQNN